MMAELKEVKRTERGWPGHQVCSPYCKFRRITVLVCENTEILICTYGDWQVENVSRAFISGYYYEARAFHATEYTHYADKNRRVLFESPKMLSTRGANREADEMHETVVSEISHRLSTGETFPTEGE